MMTLVVPEIDRDASALRGSGIVGIRNCGKFRSITRASLDARFAKTSPPSLISRVGVQIGKKRRTRKNPTISARLERRGGCARAEC